MTEALSTLFPGAATSELISSVRPGWTVLNPSIAFSPTEGYRCIIRSGNFRPDGNGGYIVNDPQQIVRTQNYFAEMDDKLSLRSLDLIDDSAVKRVEWPMVQGLEDARLYLAPDGKWHAYGTLREHRADGNCQIAEDVLEGNTIASRTVHPLREEGRPEKNWQILGEGPNFVYLHAPPTIYYPEWKHWIVGGGSVPVDSVARDFRGGSQAIPHEGGYISIIHEVTWEPGRVYHHRFVRYDAQGVITHYTPRFYLLARGFEFAAGLARYGDDFIVSFGHGDVRALLARVPIADLDTQWQDARLPS